MNFRLLYNLIIACVLALFLAPDARAGGCHPAPGVIVPHGGDTAVAPILPADTVVLPVRHDVPAAGYLPAPWEMVTNLPGDWWLWMKKTFRPENVAQVSNMAAMTGATIATDYESWQAFKAPYDRYPWFRDLSNVASFLGDGKFQGGIAVLFALRGFAAGDTTALRVASQTVEVILACGGMVQLLKHTTGRESPFVATTPTGRWNFFPNQIEYHKHVPHYDAFPSGHVATALATLTVIAENYPSETWIRWAGYPVVGMVAVGLVATSIHWWSDIPLGVALGYSFGMTVAHRNDPVPAAATGPTARKFGYRFDIPPDVSVTTLSNGTPAISFMWQW